MKVKELIEQLEQYDPEQEVGFTYDYVDKIHTSVVKKIKSFDLFNVEWSSYHQMYKISEDCDCFDEWIILM